MKDLHGWLTSTMEKSRDVDTMIRAAETRLGMPASPVPTLPPPSPCALITTWAAQDAMDDAYRHYKDDMHTIFKPSPAAQQAHSLSLLRSMQC